jgi:hypothetical protein
MEPKYVPQVGDVLFTKSGSWLSKIIRYFMTIYAKKRNYKVDFIPSHCAIVVNIWDVLMVAEANASGIEVRYPIFDYLDKNTVRIKRIINRSVDPDLSKDAIYYVLIPHRYDFLNFLFQIILVLTGHWVGPKGYSSTHRLYCSEYVARILDGCYGIFKGITWDKNPIDIEISEELEIVYQNF